MNDRYLYRSKRTDNGEWVEGDLVHSVYKINDICVGKYGSDGLWHSYNYEPVSYKVIAWQSLPEPYKQKGE